MPLRIIIALIIFLIAALALGAQINGSQAKFLPKPVCLAGKTVYINEKGAVVLKTDFDYHWADVNQFSEGLAAFSKNGKYGFIDEEGNVVIPPTFELVLDVFSDGLVIFTGQSGKYGFIDKSGRVIIPPIYDRAWSFRNGLALIAIEKGVDKKDFLGRITGGARIIIKYGFINNKGEIVIGAGKDKKLSKFDLARGFSEGLAAVKVGKEWGYINTNGEFVIRPQFRDALPFFDGLAAATTKRNEWGYIDKTGKFVISPQFADANNFSEGYAATLKTLYSSSWGFIDQSGKVVVEHKYDSVGEFENGLARVLLDHEDKKGRYIDKSGKVLSPAELATANFKNPIVSSGPRILGKSYTRYGLDYIDLRTGEYIWDAKEKNEEYGDVCDD